MTVMLEQQMLGNRSQGPPAFGGYPKTHGASDLGLLGNPQTQFAQNERERDWIIGNIERAERSPIFNRQISSALLIERVERTPVTITRQISSARLEELKKQKFTAEGKEERVAKALEVLRQDISIVLPMEVLRYIAEDPDLEDDF